MDCRWIGSCATALALGLSSLACGTGTGDGDETEGADGTGTSAPTTSADSAGTASGTADGTGDGTADGSDTSTPAGCEPSGELLFPLEVGASWVYESFVGGDCQDMPWTVTVVGTEMVDGSEAFMIEEGCEIATFMSIMRQSGQTVEVYNEGTMEWSLLITEPIEEGATWDDSHWEAAGEVTVPAGTFSDCWTAVTIFGGKLKTERRATYCPGIGPVSESGFESSRQLMSCQ